MSVAEKPSAGVAEKVTAIYFIVEPERKQLVELAGLADEGAVRPSIDSVFSLEDARSAFERVMASGKRGKVVLEIVRD